MQYYSLTTDDLIESLILYSRSSDFSALSRAVNQGWDLFNESRDLRLLYKLFDSEVRLALITKSGDALINSSKKFIPHLRPWDRIFGLTSLLSQCIVPEHAVEVLPNKNLLTLVRNDSSFANQFILGYDSVCKGSNSPNETSWNYHNNELTLFASNNMATTEFVICLEYTSNCLVFIGSFNDSDCIHFGISQSSKSSLCQPHFYDNTVFSDQVVDWPVNNSIDFFNHSTTPNNFFLIFSAARSGSTLLKNFLSSTSSIHCDHEVLHKSQIALHGGCLESEYSWDARDSKPLAFILSILTRSFDSPSNLLFHKPCRGFKILEHQFASDLRDSMLQFLQLVRYLQHH